MTLNIGMQFENWVANNGNYTKLLNNQSVPDFSFMKQDMKALPADKKSEAYQNAVLNIAQSRISNYDTNKNKKMEFDEYVKEQTNVYEKTFNEKLDLSISGMKEMLKKNFDNCDLNKDGSIDNQEMSAVFAYMDGSGDDGRLDGKISYSAAMGTNWSHPDMPDVLKTLKNFIFGK